MICLQTKYGLGHDTIDRNQITPFLFLSFISQFPYILVIFFTKMGICAFYLRIFQDPRSKLLIRLIIAFLVATEIPVSLLALLQCMPIQGFWDFKPAKCTAFSIVAYVMAAFHIFTDIILMVFVIPRVGK